MENNCLLTTLKAVINDDSLPKLNMFQISKREHTQGSGKYILVRFSENSVVRSLSSNFINAQGESIGNVINIQANTDTYILPASAADTIEFTNKDKLVSLEIFQINLNAIRWNDLGTFEYSEGLERLKIYEGNNNNYFVGSAAKIGNNTALTFIQLSRLKKITGVMEDFGTLVNLATLNVADSAITGEIEKFVAAQVRAGRTTCDSLALPYIGANIVTFNGERFAAADDTVVSWSPSATEGMTDVTLSGVGERTISNNY